MDNPPSLHRYMYAHARPTFWGDPTGNEPGDVWDPRSYDWGTFAKEAGSRTVDLGANILTVGGYGGVKRGIEEGRVTATDGLSGVEAYAEGVFNTITLGGGDRAVGAYAEGQGAGGVALEAATGVAESVLPIQEIQTIADPTKSGWEKAEAIATGTAKVAGLAAGGVAAKSALGRRAAARLPGNAPKPGVVGEGLGKPRVTPPTGSAPPVKPGAGLKVNPVRTRQQAIREALSDSKGKLLSKVEREGVKQTIRRVEDLDFQLSGSIKFRGNQGIDLAFEGVGTKTGRFALAEAKASSGLKSLSRDTLGIRQGSRAFFRSRLSRGRRFGDATTSARSGSLLRSLRKGDVDLFGGFAGSDRLIQFDPRLFLKDANLRRSRGAAQLVR